MEESWVNPKLEVRQSPIGGRGLFARESIQKEEVLTVTVGRITGAEEYWKMFAEIGDLAFNVGPGQWLAPLDIKNPSGDWLMNHSCEPNAVQTTDDNTVAWRDVAAGEEITYDYAMTEEDPSWKMGCHCGEPTCRKIITGSDWKKAEIQKKYKGFFTQSIQSQVDAL